MKKAYFLLVIAIVGCICLSCNSNTVNSSTDKLVLISDVDSIQGSKKVGNSLVGVLLKYQKEGTFFKKGSSVSLDNPKAFYLEELDKNYTNGDGYVFNYVLYVPDCIQDVYESAGGKKPHSGNPFWWYMKEYYGATYQVIIEDWGKTLPILLENKQKLSYPKAEDVGAGWRT
jgi:hypothetical protein